MVMIIWLVSCYAHVYVRLEVVIVTDCNDNGDMKNYNTAKLFNYTRVFEWFFRCH